MFSTRPKTTFPQVLGSILLATLILGFTPVSKAANTMDENSTTPVGSHADAHAQFANARHLWQSGKLRQAAALYESLIERYPDLPDPYNNLAVIYAAQGDYKKAQQFLEKGLNTHPGYAAIYENLTAIYVEMARDSYGKALQFSDKSHRQLKLRALAEISDKPVEAAKAAPPVTEPPVTVLASDSSTTKKIEQVVSEVEAPVLSATSSVKPVETVESLPASQTIDEGAVKAVLESWATAWSEQSVEKYLQYYEQTYHPPGMSRQKWESQRLERIKRPQWIRVSLSDYLVETVTEQRVRVKVKQRYQSNSYSDNGHKEFELIETEQGWRIVSERSL